MRKWSFIGAGVVLLAAIVAFIWWITAIGAWPIVRDIVIVLAAMLNLAVTILLAAAVICFFTAGVSNRKFCSAAMVMPRTWEGTG